MIVGQEIATTDGMLVGLFLTHPVATGLVPEDAAAAVHAQGGLVMVPHPDAGAPPAATLRRLGGSIDLHQIMSGADDVADPAAPALRRLGLRVCAGSGATRPQEVGTAVTEMPLLRRPGRAARARWTTASCAATPVEGPRTSRGHGDDATDRRSPETQSCRSTGDPGKYRRRR